VDRLPIRIRVSLSIFAVSTGLLVVMSAAVYGVFARQLQVSLDDTLRLQATANLELVDVSVSPPALALGIDPGHGRSTGEAVLRLYSRTGTLLGNGSPATRAAPAERDAVLDSLREGRDLYRTIDLDNDQDYRIVVSPLRVDGVIAGALVTGIAWMRVDRPLTMLRLILLVAVAVTAVALALGAYLIARRALWPVTTMAATARGIAQGNLDQRIQTKTSKDELGQLATTLNSMIARLSETIDRERRFTSDASHELRTPLAAIAAGIDIALGQDREAGEYRQVLQLVRHQTERLSALAKQLLLLSRLDARELQADFAPIELNGLLRAVASSFAGNHPAAELWLTAPPFPFEVYGDIALLARAFGNVLDNAIDHAGPSVRLTITVERAPDGRAKVLVGDDGPGIPDHMATSIFQRFRRGDASRSGRGTGLGLAIVEAIIHAHDGEVRLLPFHQGRGAQFEITLPRSPCA
jgi:signal transduction histidine kinase